MFRGECGVRVGVDRGIGITLRVGWWRCVAGLVDGDRMLGWRRGECGARGSTSGGVGTWVRVSISFEWLAWWSGWLDLGCGDFIVMCEVNARGSTSGGWSFHLRVGVVVLTIRPISPLVALCCDFGKRALRVGLTSGVVAVGMAFRWGGGLGFDFVRSAIYPPISVKCGGDSAWVGCFDLRFGGVWCLG